MDPNVAPHMVSRRGLTIAGLGAFGIAAIIVVQDWRKIHIRSAGLLLGATLLGTPIGLLLLTYVPGTIVKRILAIVIH